MIRLLKSSIKYYRLYRYRNQEEKLEKKLKHIKGKIEFITLALKTGYRNEKEFFESISKLNRKLAGEIPYYADAYNQSLKVSRNITEKVGKAVEEYKGTNNGQK